MADFSKLPSFKIANSQNFLLKILWIGPWVSRIDWCKGHWCSSTYMVVRLSDIRAKTGKKCIFCVLGCSCPNEFSWKIFENWWFWKMVILKNGHFGIFFCLIPMKISDKLCDRMDGTDFWCFPWFPANSLLCVILRYTVYKQLPILKASFVPPDGLSICSKFVRAP